MSADRHVSNSPYSFGSQASWDLTILTPIKISSRVLCLIDFCLLQSSSKFSPTTSFQTLAAAEIQEAFLEEGQIRAEHPWGESLAEEG